MRRTTTTASKRKQQQTMSSNNNNNDLQNSNNIITTNYKETMAASPRNSSPNSPIYFTIRFTKFCIIIALLAASISILFLAETSYKNHLKEEMSASYDGGKSTTTETTSIVDTNAIKAHEVKMELPFGSGSDKQSLSYYHCGQTFTSSSSSNHKMTSKDTEIILLHGAKFTKEDWKESEILQNICLKGNENPSEHGRLSIVALDLSVRADYKGLHSAFQSLVEGNVLSGNPVVIVSPSASGKSIVSLLPMKENDEKTTIAKSMIKIWMPVASSSVLQVKDHKSLHTFKELGIPILAMNGDGDQMGKKVTERLVKYANAKGVEMKGGHPCYLDSPEYFVDVILSFLHGSTSDAS